MERNTKELHIELLKSYIEHKFAYFDATNDARSSLTSPDKKLDFCQHYYVKALLKQQQHKYDEALRLAFRCKGLLPNDYWQVMRQEAIQISMLIAECSYILGYYAQALNFLEQIERHAESRLEKLKLYKLYAYVYMNEVDNGKLVDVVRKAFNEIQLLVPKKIGKCHVVRQYWQLQWKLKNLNEQTIEQLPTMQHEEDVVFYQTLVYLLCREDLLEQHELQYFIYRAMQFTILKGTCAESSIVFKKYAIVAGIVHDNL